MHLTSHPKLVRSELRLDVVGVQTFSQQGALLRTCGSNHGNVTNRIPLSVISTNMLRCSNESNNSSVSGSVAALQLKVPPTSTLQLLPLPTGYENDMLRIYQTATEDTETTLDIWTVIKPGHVREKIAMFASDAGRADSTRDREHTSNMTAAMCSNHATMSGLFRAVKAKGSWEENSSAKRRRRSGNHQNLQQDQRTQQHTNKPSPRRMDWTQQPGDRWRGGEEDEQEQKVSVVEMVAFLEQRVNEQQLESKPLLTLQRSSTTITLSRAPPLEIKGEEPESIKVSDMVARLESECLRRRTEGDLSRSNSLRRTVGRVLLAAGEQGSACQPASQQSTMSSMTSPSLPGAAGREPTSCSETPAAALATPPSPDPSPSEDKCQEDTPPPPEEVEPLPGLLFLSPPPAASETRTDSAPPPREPRPPPACSDSGSQSEKRRRRRKVDWVQEEASVTPPLAVVPLGRRASASQDFLELRQRLQQLLEPQPYLSVLPHHLLLKILLLLPTQSLAALKCTCRYFKFIIDNYGVRPADSLWVSDPRYRDDPCKQCKKRYGRGDVSLCRWHHKPYCQALPYGPGYWMCCHGVHRDSPGCNVGLHDNRWVPAFHSINVPIYRRSRNDA
ncbi:F-box only protein 34 [Nibea albiflora]|uniref:F-box only protein 34 n=1 Tax=Nibea albiflora TaxID=240163 RepID=A0ACB7FGA8_NIBAL|nr:F-box only protein 34 [Nibea albiflora]